MELQLESIRRSDTRFNLQFAMSKGPGEGECRLSIPELISPRPEPPENLIPETTFEVDGRCFRFGRDSLDRSALRCSPTLHVVLWHC